MAVQTRRGCPGDAPSHRALRGRPKPQILEMCKMVRTQSVPLDDTIASRVPFTGASMLSYAGGELTSLLYESNKQYMEPYSRAYYTLRSCDCEKVDRTPLIVIVL